jgi:hypothetical protein
MSPDAQAMNGSVVSSVTDKFGFMCGEGDETDHRTEQEREATTASGTLHTDLEILRYYLSSSNLHLKGQFIGQSSSGRLIKHLPASTPTSRYSGSFPSLSFKGSP